MADPQQVLGARVRDALVAAYGADYGDADPLIRPSQFADLQSNVALPLGKRLGQAPRDVANEIVGHLDIDDVTEPPTVSGPGFINFTLRPRWIADATTRLLADPRLGVPLQSQPKTVIVEYSSPNIAKEMHVGHLRTTIVGDAIARVTEFVGDHLIRDNHVGDWGTPFGMLIEHLLDVGEDSPEAGLLRTDPNAFYQAARVKFDSDPVFADRARERVVELQSGTDPATLQLWEDLVDMSKAYLRGHLRPARVTLTDDDIRGESFYNDLLARTSPRTCMAKGIARISDGALCAFPPGFTGRDGNAAAADHPQERRRLQLRHDRPRRGQVPGRQGQRRPRDLRRRLRPGAALPDGLRRRAGGRLAARGPGFEHAQIGMVHGKDGHRLRTRAGDTSSSATCSPRASSGPAAILDEVDAGTYDAADLDAIAEDVGIGAIKYADLSTARDSAYLFDWDRMISFRGNTGPYLQYATARIRSIFRRAGIDETTAGRPASSITAPPERELALQVAQLRRGRHPGRRDRGTAPAVRATCSRSPACSPRSTSSARCSRRTTTRSGSPAWPCARPCSAC